MAWRDDPFFSSLLHLQCFGSDLFKSYLAIATLRRANSDPASLSPAFIFCSLKIKNINYTLYYKKIKYWRWIFNNQFYVHLYYLCACIICKGENKVFEFIGIFHITISYILFYIWKRASRMNSKVKPIIFHQFLWEAWTYLFSLNADLVQSRVGSWTKVSSAETRISGRARRQLSANIIISLNIDYTFNLLSITSSILNFPCLKTLHVSRLYKVAKKLFVWRLERL